MMKEYIDIMPKPWQVNIIIDIIYKKNNIIILADKKSEKSLLYQLIPFIREEVIVWVILSTITLMTD